MDKQRPLFYQILMASLLPLSVLFAEFQSSSPIIYNPVPAVEYRSIEKITAAGDEQPPDQPFQLCSTCRCCAATDQTSCLSMPCCFHIDCGLLNKPYGVCAFAPYSCNCTACP